MERVAVCCVGFSAQGRGSRPRALFETPPKSSRSPEASLAALRPPFSAERWPESIVRGVSANKKSNRVYAGGGCLRAWRAGALHKRMA
jgi:hypothetical protein